MLPTQIHIEVQYGSDIYNTFREAMISRYSISEMPTNALLIVCHSKIYDIEQTLVYGIHGVRNWLDLLYRKFNIL